MFNYCSSLSLVHFSSSRFWEAAVFFSPKSWTWTALGSHRVGREILLIRPIRVALFIVAILPFSRWSPMRCFHLSHQIRPIHPSWANMTRFFVVLFETVRRLQFYSLIISLWWLIIEFFLIIKCDKRALPSFGPSWLDSHQVLRDLEWEWERKRREQRQSRGSSRKGGSAYDYDHRAHRVCRFMTIHSDTAHG